MTKHTITTKEAWLVTSGDIVPNWGTVMSVEAGYDGDDLQARRLWFRKDMSDAVTVDAADLHFMEVLARRMIWVCEPV